MVLAAEAMAAVAAVTATVIIIKTLGFFPTAVAAFTGNLSVYERIRICKHQTVNLTVWKEVICLRFYILTDSVTHNPAGLRIPLINYEEACS